MTAVPILTQAPQQANGPIVGQATFAPGTGFNTLVGARALVQDPNGANILVEPWLAQLEANQGRQFAFRNHSLGNLTLASDPTKFPTSGDVASWAAGRIIYFQFGFGSAGTNTILWTQVALGTYDTFFTTIATHYATDATNGLAANPNNQIYFCFDHEPADNASAVQGFSACTQTATVAACTPAATAYVNMFNHLANLFTTVFASHGVHLRTVSNPTGQLQFVYGALVHKQFAEGLYGGVDIWCDGANFQDGWKLGIDSYHKVFPSNTNYNSNVNPNAIPAPESATDLGIVQAAAKATALGVPLFIGEHGYAPYQGHGDRDDANSKAYWFDTLFNLVQSLGNVEGLCFQANIPPTQAYYQWDDQNQVDCAAAYEDGINNPIFAQFQPSFPVVNNNVTIYAGFDDNSNLQPLGGLTLPYTLGTGRHTLYYQAKDNSSHVFSDIAQYTFTIANFGNVAGQITVLEQERYRESGFEARKWEPTFRGRGDL